MQQYYKKRSNPLRPQTPKEWFILWLIIIIICILICLIVMIIDRQLDTNDFLQYIRPIRELTPEQLKHIDPNMIPELVDYAEDDYHT
jgi:hypothetical protein